MKKIILQLIFTIVLYYNGQSQWTTTTPASIGNPTGSAISFQSGGRGEIIGDEPGIWLSRGSFSAPNKISFIGKANLTSGAANHIFGIWNNVGLGTGWSTFNIFDNGNVGIGLANPMAQLHTTGTVRFAGLGTSNNTDFIVSDGNGNLSKRSMTSFGGNTTNACFTLNMVPRLTNVVNNTYSCGVMMDNGTNVGIGGGAAIPQARLDVSGGGLFRNGNNFAPTVHQLLFAWNNSSGAGNLYQHGIRTRHDGNNTNNNSIDFHLWRTVDGASGLPSLRAMTLNNQGRLGINLATGSPLNNLHVEGDARITNLPPRALNDRLVFANSAGELKSLNPGTQNEYLRGDGSWGTVSGVNIYNSDGTLTADRLMELSDRTLTFNCSNNLPNTPNTNNPKFTINSNNTLTQGTLMALNYNGTNSATGGRTGLAINTSTPGSLGSANQGLTINVGGSSGHCNGIRSQVGYFPSSIDYNTNALFLTAMGSVENIGIRTWAQGGATASTSNLAIWAEAGTASANSFAGYFSGNIAHTGTITSVSDLRLKKDINPIQNALSILSKMQPKSYIYDNHLYPSLNLSSSDISYGLIAQELETILPSLVKSIPVPTKNEKGESDFREKQSIKSINYIELIPIAISAIKELNAKVEKQNNTVVENDALKTKIASLEEKLAAQDEKFALLEKTITQLCESGCEGLKKTGEGSSSQVDVLYQSIPNPTDDIALINYYLTKEYKDAYINISTQDGKQIQSFKLEPKQGAGSVKVSLGTLASGTYLYNLVAAERFVDTKRLQIIK